MRTVEIVCLTFLAMLMRGQEPSPPPVPKSAIASEISTLDKMGMILNGVPSVQREQTAVQSETFVVMQIVGTAALVQPEGVTDSTPMTLVLPRVSAHGDDAEHVAYLAWHPLQEVKIFRSDYGQRETENGDPAPWRFFTIERQELVVMHNDLDNVPGNTATIPVSRGGNCNPLNPDFACVPRTRDFIPAGVKVRVNPEFLAPTHPHRNVQARMEIKSGVKLLPEVRDACEWEFRAVDNPAQGGSVRKQRAAGLVNYIFRIRGTTLSLGTRSLDQDQAPTVKLLEVQATSRDPVIHIRIGNSPGVFPDPASVRDTDPDHHYDTYYDLLIDDQGAPVRPDLRLLPFRDKDRKACPAFNKPTITCGPGWI